MKYDYEEQDNKYPLLGWILLLVLMMLIFLIYSNIKLTNKVNILDQQLASLTQTSPTTGSVTKDDVSTIREQIRNSSTTSISNSEGTLDVNLHDSDENNSQEFTKHPTPPHGYFLWGKNEVTYQDEYVGGFNGDELYAPLEIKPPYDDLLYLVKFKSIWNPDIEYQIFVKGGRSPIEVNILCGTYSLSYATGSTWYGKNDLFGHETRYYKSDESFRFYHDGRDVCGQSITLYTVPNGNLSVEEISSDEF